MKVFGSKRQTKSKGEKLLGILHGPGSDEHLGGSPSGIWHPQPQVLLRAGHLVRVTQGPFRTVLTPESPFPRAKGTLMT